MDEQESVWWDLCREAWTEEDPIKFLDVTMQITKFLARKQQRLDAEYERSQRRNA
jgi:hypothetical protein